MGDFTKVAVLYACISLMLFFGGVRVIGDDSYNMVDNFVQANKTADGQVILNPDLVDKLPTTFEKSGSGVLDFIDSLGALGTFIAFIVNIVFTPLGLFTGAGMPVGITLLVGVPIMLLLFFGAAYFIRSGA